MLVVSCAFIGICLFIFGSFGNGLCILVFLRKKFRYRIITPYFIILLIADSVYLLFRLIKLPYYSQTLFRLHTGEDGSCSNTFLGRAYESATQNWPQILLPFVNSETYIRFSLILMSIMSVQRTIFITRSSKLLVLPATFTDKYKYKGTIMIILSAFLIAYTFECAGQTVFCSKSSNRNITYDWFLYMNKHMQNDTFVLTNTMTDRPDALKCVNTAIQSLQKNQTLLIEGNSMCKKEELIDILSHYFDQHERPIVNLIRQIILLKTGHRMARNEIRLRYHFHECLFPQDPKFFDRYYDFMYSRTFNMNRHTLLLIFGSIIPSLITILGNILSVCRVQELNRVTSVYILPCRRRIDDTRRVLIVITVECLFAIFNSWFCGRLLSVIYCKGKLLVGDDCPDYFKQSYEILVMLDILNSVSNIVLHCLCGRHFRNELRLMFMACMEILKGLFHRIWCCYFQINCTKIRKEEYVTYNVAAARQEKNSSSSSHNHLYFHTQPTPESDKNCCDCRWYCNRKPLALSQQDLRNDQTPHATRYTPLTQQTSATRQTQVNSMRLYYPPAQ